MTSTQVVEMSVATSSRPPQGYTNTDNQPTTNTGSLGSQPTTILFRATLTWTINQLQTLGHSQQPSLSGLRQPGRSTSYKHQLTRITTNDSPQDYTNPDNKPATNTDSLGSQPTTILLRTTPSRTIDQL